MARHDSELFVPRRDAAWVALQHGQLAGVPPREGRPRHFIMTAFTRFGVGGKGKIYLPEYIAPFTARLAERGVDFTLALNEDELEAALDDRDTAILHMFNEEKVSPYNARIRAAEARAGVVFCSQRAGEIVSLKRRANLYLTARGIAMPEIVSAKAGADSLPAPVFSNAAIGSGRRTAVLTRPEQLAEDRYNARYIDTRLTFDGTTYHTMFRIQAVGRQVQHAYPRARDVRERSASVHSRDTPANGPLIEFLFQTLIEPRRDEITAHARLMGEILGPGFYAHDMVVCNSTGALYMVESGFKFNDTPYANYLIADAARMPSNRVFYTGAYPVIAADLCLQEWDHVRDHGQPDPSGADLWTDPAFA